MSRSQLAIIPYQPTNHPSQPIDSATKLRQRAFRYASHHARQPRISFHDYQPLPANRALSFGDSGHDEDGKVSRKPTSDTLSDHDLQVLQDHIDCLIEQTQAQHKCKPYHVTRILTPEFSFYTHTPLSSEQLATLIDWLQCRMAELPANIHCLLSSFAVTIKLQGSPQLLNVACYATSGKDATVHTIIKARPSQNDVDYAGHYTLFNQNLTEPGRVSDTLFHGVLTDDKISIHNNRILTLDVDDTTIDCIVSICFDHKNFAGLAYFASAYITDSAAYSKQITYIVSSNIIEVDISEAPCLATSQADPIMSRTHSSFVTGDNAVTVIESAFGPTLTLYDMGETHSAELVTPLEQLRRQNARCFLQTKLSYHFSDEDIKFEIERLIKFECYEQAIRLLPLLIEIDETITLTLIKHCPLRLPQYELNMTLYRHSSAVSDTELYIISERIGDLEPRALNAIAPRLVSSQTPIVLDRLFSVAHLLSEDNFYLALMRPAFITTLSLVPLAKLVNELHRDTMKNWDVINLLMSRYPEMPNFCKIMMISACPLMNTTSLDHLCKDLKHMERHQVRYIFGQFSRMSSIARHLTLQQHRKLSRFELLTTITSKLHMLPDEDIDLLMNAADRLSLEDILHSVKHAKKIPSKAKLTLWHRASQLLPSNDKRLEIIKHTFGITKSSSALAMPHHMH